LLLRRIEGAYLRPTSNVDSMMVLRARRGGTGPSPVPLAEFGRGR
jgi:hypothetical protein